MFRIGEFSKLTQVTIRMLRYYDEMGLLKPAEIAVALNNQDDSFVIEQLDNKHREIERAIQIEKEKLRKIELAKKELQSTKNEMHYNISIKSIPSYQVLALRRIIPDYYCEGDLWQELSAFAIQHQVEVSSNTFSIYHDIEYKETSVDVELCAPVKKMGKSIGDFIYRTTEPIPIMACTMVYGAFTNIAGVYLAFAEWLQKNSQYRMLGLSRQIVHRGAWNETDPEKYLVEIQIPLENG